MKRGPLSDYKEPVSLPCWWATGQWGRGIGSSSRNELQPDNALAGKITDAVEKTELLAHQYRFKPVAPRLIRPTIEQFVAVVRSDKVTSSASPGRGPG